ncbi:MAG: P27 family phage terminase small subunit, partial [Phycisphaerales bacterium]
QRGDGVAAAQKRPACPRRFINKQKTEDGEAVRLVAKRTWDRLAPALYEAGLLADTYRETLECLCDSFGRYTLACAKCDGDEGMVIGTDKGNLVQSPWVAIRNKMYDQVYKAAACFGLTPADVSGVRAVEKPTAEDDKKKFFKTG